MLLHSTKENCLAPNRTVVLSLQICNHNAQNNLVLLLIDSQIQVMSFQQVETSLALQTPPSRFWSPNPMSKQRICKCLNYITSIHIMNSNAYTHMHSLLEGPWCFNFPLLSVLKSIELAITSHLAPLVSHSHISWILIAQIYSITLDIEVKPIISLWMRFVQYLTFFWMMMVFGQICTLLD